MKIFTFIAAIAVLSLFVSCTEDNDADPTESNKVQSNYDMYSKPGDTLLQPPPQIIPGEPVPPKGKD